MRRVIMVCILASLAGCGGMNREKLASGYKETVFKISDSNSFSGDLDTFCTQYQYSDFGKHPEEQANRIRIVGTVISNLGKPGIGSCRSGYYHRQDVIQIYGWEFARRITHTCEQLNGNHVIIKPSKVTVLGDPTPSRHSVVHYDGAFGWGYTQSWNLPKFKNGEYKVRADKNILVEFYYYDWEGPRRKGKDIDIDTVIRPGDQICVDANLARKWYYPHALFVKYVDSFGVR